MQPLKGAGAKPGALEPTKGGLAEEGSPGSNKKQAQARAGPASVPSIGSRKYLQGPGSQLGPVWCPSPPWLGSPGPSYLPALA